jgi:hypothetical protein
MVGERHGGSRLGPAKAIEARVDDDTVQPRRDLSVAAEGRCGSVSLQKGVLERVGGLFWFSRGAQRNRPQSIAMPADQRREGRWVASDVRRQQLGVRSLVF